MPSLPHRLAIISLSVAVVVPAALVAQRKPTIEQFMGPASPLELVSSRKVDRVAWIVYEKGMRNV